MPGEQGKAAEVRPIYRKGDRVLVELPFGYCDVIIEGSEVEGGRLRLYGVCGGWGIRFTADAVACRLGRHQVLSWKDVF
jgi:hypothetical protein